MDWVIKARRVCKGEDYVKAADEGWGYSRAQAPEHGYEISHPLTGVVFVTDSMLRKARNIRDKEMRRRKKDL
jgi:hypothetical protein